ncbi:AzlD domain-containing protein [Thauera sp. CAU 1555]|jgi:branched-subunit amino acid transport protein|uniref:AzlD domain-containing protein n=1 Tax=Thauera sedimentorum TaxID=2767595 RepID=A0ABR9BF32_9RHOO|nr:AzlD domain-containing protein [Thauera sedimentorum]MBC9073146.1 AzlD domain-containing protein [Thauera sedimentorum]MBD8504065.1 AzlD domain-containing protein [Thauera sedimentorum]
MSEGLWLWLTLAAIGSTTILTRGSFIIPGERARLPATLQRALRYAPAAALAALIAPDLLLAGGEFAPLNPKLAAGIVVILVCTSLRNPWLPFIAGMGVLLLLRKGFGL